MIIMNIRSCAITCNLIQMQHKLLHRFYYSLSRLWAVKLLSHQQCWRKCCSDGIYNRQFGSVPKDRITDKKQQLLLKNAAQMRTIPIPLQEIILGVENA